MEKYSRRVIKLHLRALEEPTHVARGLTAIKQMLLERKDTDLKENA